MGSSYAQLADRMGSSHDANQIDAPEAAHEAAEAAAVESHEAVDDELADDELERLFESTMFGDDFWRVARSDPSFMHDIPATEAERFVGLDDESFRLAMNDVDEESYLGALDGVSESDRTQCLPKLLGFVGKVTSVLKIVMFDLTHPTVALFLLALLRMNVKLSTLIITNASTAANQHSLVEKLRGHERVQVIIFHKTMHCEDIIIDDKFLITGSANATLRGLEGNIESMMVFKTGTPLTSAIFRVTAVLQSPVLHCSNPPAAPLVRKRTKTMMHKFIDEFTASMERMTRQFNELEEKRREDASARALKRHEKRKRHKERVVQRMLSECKEMNQVFTDMSAYNNKDFGAAEREQYLIMRRCFGLAQVQYLKQYSDKTE